MNADYRDIRAAIGHRQITISTRVARLAFFRPNFRNLASFQVDWPKKF